MQIKDINSNYLQNPWLIGVVKLVLFLACLYFLIEKMSASPIDFGNVVLPDQFTSIAGFVFILMFFNWYLEALRWKLSLSLFEKISISSALVAVYSGIALNWVLPFTTGDLVARISQQQDKFQTTSAAILNRGIMLIITLIFALAGSVFIAKEYDFNGWFSLVIIFGISLIWIFFKKKIERFLIYFHEIQRKLLLQVIGLSILRYAVFVFQFYLLLNVFLPHLDPSLLTAGIGWIFFVRSVLPLFFGGIGVREASGVFFFAPHVADIQMIILPIFLIWMINTVIPSFIGLLFIWRLQLTSNYSK